MSRLRNIFQTHWVLPALLAALILGSIASPADATELHDAAQARDTSKVRSLLQDGAEVNVMDSFGRTPLHSFFLGEISDRWPRQSMIIKYLIDAGAFLNAKDSAGDTPLHDAASRSQERALELDALFRASSYSEEKLDVNAKNNLGNTPLHVVSNSWQAASYLIVNGADLDAKNNDGKTPLDIALKSDKTEVVKAIHEASKTIREASEPSNPDGISPF